MYNGHVIAKPANGNDVTTAIKTYCKRAYQTAYCKTLNVSVPFISQAKENREIRGREYQLQDKITTVFPTVWF